jgi:serine/threonine-protein kinase HipA
MTARKLEVYLYNRKAGVLTDIDGELSFKYSNNADRPLSVRLPVREKEYGDRECRAFFENLLPEGDIREIIARKERVSEGNVFSLLDKIGGDCAGAVSLYEEGQNRVDAVKKEPFEICADELFRIMDSQKTDPLLTGKNIRLSLAGAQVKFAVYMKEDKMYYPNDTFFSSHLIKPENRDFEDFVLNEYFCMKLAGSMNITVPDVRLKKVKGMQYLIIERFDRLAADGQKERLHQEDFCQILGSTPDRKYQKEGGPGFKECYKFLENETGIHSLESFVFIFIFNYLTGNCDAHAKNFSVLHDVEKVFVRDNKMHTVCKKGAVALAPFYDLVSTEVYEGLSKEMAMKIGGAWDIRDVQKHDFYKTAREINIKEKEMDSLIQKFSSMPIKAHGVMREIKEMGFNTAVCGKIISGMEKRLGKISGKIGS